MKRLFYLLIVAMLPAVAHAAPRRAAPLATWHLTLETSRGHVVKNEWLPIWRAHHRPFGHWIRRSQTDHGVMIVEYPILHRPAPRPALRSFVQAAAPSGGYTASYSVTAYAPGCGASGPMADGQMPFVGAAAATLPFGTRVDVGGLGWLIVEDRGVGPGDLDVFMASCQAAIAWGRRQMEVTVY